MEVRLIQPLKAPASLEGVLLKLAYALGKLNVLKVYIVLEHAFAEIYNTVGKVDAYK